MQQLDLLVSPAQPQVSNSWDKDELTSQLSDLCDTLLAESFRWHDVQQALQVCIAQQTASRKCINKHSGVCLLQAVPMERMSEAIVLDWLCLHVDPAHLPRRSDSTSCLPTDGFMLSCSIDKGSLLQVCWGRAVTNKCIRCQTCGQGKRQAKTCSQGGYPHHIT